MNYDLNDLYFFVQVVEHKGFAPAGRALGIPKSRLSRRIAELEARLGVRLLQRTSRRFAVTDVGQIYLHHCQALLAQAQAAQEAIEHLQAEPRGHIRISCPITIAQTLMAGILAEFMAIYPLVTVAMEVTNRRVDIIEEGFDLALRVRNVVEDSSLIMRTLIKSRLYLVASPQLLTKFGAPIEPQDLQRFPSLSIIVRGKGYAWSLHTVNGANAHIEHLPKLQADDFVVLREAALAGVGIVAMPEYLCREALDSGALVQVLPTWSLAGSTIHVVFPSRRGVIPAVRSLIDYLVQRFPEVAAQIQFGDY